MYDYSGTDVAPDPNSHAQLIELVTQLNEALGHLEDCDKAKKAAEHVVKDLSEHKIPDLMEDLGVSELKLTNGLKVEIGSKLRTSLPKARMGEIMAWLKEHGHEGIIKNQVVVEFPVGEDERATELLQNLQGDYENIANQKNVHAATVKALIAELQREGIDVPLDLFGTYEQRFTKVG